MPLALSTPVKFVKRVGERIGDALAKRGIETVEDLLYHLPFRYEDRLSPRPIAEMLPGEMASLLGDVRGSNLLTTKNGTLFEMTLGPGRARHRRHGWAAAARSIDHQVHLV